MYTGTLIRDLMAMVERAEFAVERQRLDEERELRAMFSLELPAMQIPAMLISVEGDRVFQGAA